MPFEITLSQRDVNHPFIDFTELKKLLICFNYANPVFALYFLPVVYCNDFWYLQYSAGPIGISLAISSGGAWEDL